MERESSLDADAEGYAANGEGFADAAAAAGYNGAFIRLNPFAVSFDNLVVNPDVVADVEIGNVGP